jgi:hypothetical protein
MSGDAVIFSSSHDARELFDQQKKAPPQFWFLSPTRM